MRVIFGGLVGGLLGAFSTHLFLEIRKEVQRYKQGDIYLEETDVRVAPEPTYEHLNIDPEEDIEEMYEESSDLIFDNLEDVPSTHDGREIRPYYTSDYREIMNLMAEFNKEELENLRFDVNSEGALQQYKAMMMAEIQDSEWRDIVYRLFDYTFEPINELDNRIRDHALVHREEFFGMESIFYGTSTVAEIILHFAELMSLDFGESMDFYVEELVSNLDIHHDSSKEEYDKMVHHLVNHELYTKSGFGMFGLTQYQQVNLEPSFFSEYNNCRHFDEMD